jgi:hypothetical protein
MALPERTNVLTTDRFPELPKSWSELTWQQLCTCWQVKMQYGGNADVARAAALLELVSSFRFQVSRGDIDPRTGEQQYILSTPSLTGRARGGSAGWVFVPRELSQMAQQALPWFDYPYGDPGKEAVKDEKGKVIEEAVSPVRGYVSGMRDALILSEDEIVVHGSRVMVKGSNHTSHLSSAIRHLTSAFFSLPQMACNNLTWQQYRSLQAITPQLFQEGISDEDALDLQAQFLAHCLTPRSLALLDTTAGSIRLRPHHTYQYDAIRAEKYVRFWRKRLLPSLDRRGAGGGSLLFHICFQAYQTALTYYAQAYPLLFSDDKKDTMNDALQGEVGTINTIMKYAGYSEQQQVYDSNLPFVLDILNKMATEAKEIEKMNAKIKKK